MALDLSYVECVEIWYARKRWIIICFATGGILNAPNSTSVNHYISVVGYVINYFEVSHVPVLFWNVTYCYTVLANYICCTLQMGCWCVDKYQILGIIFSRKCYFGVVLMIKRSVKIINFSQKIVSGLLNRLFEIVGVNSGMPIYNYWRFIFY